MKMVKALLPFPACQVGEAPHVCGSADRFLTIGAAAMSLDSVPGMVAVLTPRGEVDVVHNQLVEYCHAP